MPVDFHVHGLGHATSRHTVEELSAYINTGIERGIKEIGFADHDMYLEMFNFPNLEKVREEFSQVNIRIGMEMDFFPDKIEQIKAKIASYPFDFVIGSVHDIGDWNFDHPDYQANFARWEIDILYCKYFELVGIAARSGLFDFIGHFDLMKVFGHRPKTRVEVLAEPALQMIRQAGVAVEINTNGRYKPVEEIYPSEELLTRCFELDIPVTLSSDAHEAGNVGRDIDLAVRLAKKVGYRKVAAFAKRKMFFMEI